MTDPIKDKLQKLARVAARGVGGEADNAERIFEALLKKHGLRREDFIDTDQQKDCVWFPFRIPHERMLLCHIVMMVLDDWRPDMWTSDAKPGKVAFDLTRAQAAEIHFLFAVYKRAFKQELRLFENAFVQKQGLWPPSAPMPEDYGQKKKRQPSDDDMERSMAMEAGIKSVQPRKAIEARR